MTFSGFGATRSSPPSVLPSRGAPVFSPGPSLDGAGYSSRPLAPRKKQPASSYGRDSSGKPKPRRLTNALLRDLYTAAKGDPAKAAALYRAYRDRDL